jgi:DNA-binding ferritin-like protein
MKVDPVEKAKSVVLQQHYKEPDMKQDLTDAYQQSKENLQEIIDQGKDAMEEILQVAKAGQHPREFEVYGTLLKNMVDANKELLNIQKQMREMDGKKKDNGDTKIDKAIFVGSTAELNKLLNNKE